MPLRQYKFGNYHFPLCRQIEVWEFCPLPLRKWEAVGQEEGKKCISVGRPQCSLENLESAKTYEQQVLSRGSKTQPATACLQASPVHNAQLRHVPERGRA